MDEFGYLSCEWHLVEAESGAHSAAWLDGGGNENDAQDDDEDLKSDPIAQIDLGVRSFPAKCRLC